jgi:hypothetical protein
MALGLHCHPSQVYQQFPLSAEPGGVYRTVTLSRCHAVNCTLVLTVIPGYAVYIRIPN